MQFSLAFIIIAHLLQQTSSVSSVRVSDVVPYYSHPGQGSHTRLGASNHQAGLLYQQSPIKIRLTGDTVVLRQEVNSDILNKKMSTLNKFQQSVTDKIESLHNTSILSLLPLDTLYSI